MKDKIFGVLQRVGRSFMLPIAILPVAGLLLGIGGSFSNETMLQTYGLMNAIGPGTIWNTLFKLMSDAGNVIFANLPLIFAIGVAVGMAKQEKAVAALSAVIAFLIMHTVIGSHLQLAGKVIIDGNTVTYAKDVLSGTITSVLGIQSLQMGVFGGIIVGLGVAALHNRFYKIELPQVLSFFGGTRFVPIVSALTYFVVGLGMYYVWPVVQEGIYALGGVIQNSGYAGTFIYGLIERALIPFGLHHVFYLPFWQTGVGGSMVVAGKTIEGAQNIFFAQLADPSTSVFSVAATRFMSGKFPLMIFGLPGAALAMYRCADPKKRKLAGSLLLSAALTSMITGITEPIEFTFLFVAPLLYAVHCVFAGAAYMLMHIFKVGVGMTFSGGIIDLTLFGVMQGNSKTNWIWVVIIGILYFIVYYAVFTLLIKKMNLKTPGRGDDEGEVKLYTRADVNARKSGEAGGQEIDEQSMLITAGLGGMDNISDVDCCATRLRTTVKDSSKVNKDVLKQSGAAGVIVKGNGVQVIYGPRVTVIKSNLELFLKTPNAADATVENLLSGAETTEAPKTEEVKEAKSGKNAEVYAPINGKAVELKAVGDGVFSEEMLGKGMAIEPADGNVYAPFDGTVAMVFDTKHALGLTSDDGVELLIHVGLDTVQLNGKHYDIKTQVGAKIKKGDLLATFDMEGIKEEGYQIITPVIVTNTDAYTDINPTNLGVVKAGTKVLDIK